MPPHVERAAPVPASNGTHPPKPAMADTPALVELTEATAGKVWARSVESISDPILHAMASQVGTVRLNPPKELVLSFAASAGTSRRLCEEKAELIARTVEQVTGIAISLRFEESADDPSRRPAGAGRNQASLREEANRESIVQQAEDLLGAKIYGEITVVDVAPAVPNDPTDSASETPDADE